MAKIPFPFHTFFTDGFYRVNKARSRSNGGSGLGLSIVKKLVELQKGELKIESKEKIGTKVSVTFPIIATD